ncbi:MAG: hypothetical protein IJN97_02775 [Oscillospiraceae bacterium]|nr:hypothetical protein [Oscillospiraceae bacterium]
MDANIADKLVEVATNVERNHESGRRKGFEETETRINELLELLIAYADTYINYDEEERKRVEALIDEASKEFEEWAQKWKT